jgi:hypothetical protein
MKKIKTLLTSRSAYVMCMKPNYVLASLLIVGFVGMVGFGGFGSRPAMAAIKTGGTTSAKYHCGGSVTTKDPNTGKVTTKDESVKTSINIGCVGKGYAMVDALFAIIRFLSVGVGMVVVASLVWAGVQYTASRGDPGATAKAIERIQNTLIALLVYIFAAALLNFVIPKGFLNL